MYARNDAPGWQRWRFQLGAMTVLLPRIFLGIFNIFVLYVLVEVLMIGQKRNEPLANGWRKTCLRYAYICTTQLVGVFSFWTYFSHTYVD